MHIAHHMRLLTTLFRLVGFEIPSEFFSYNKQLKPRSVFFVVLALFCIGSLSTTFQIQISYSRIPPCFY